MKKFLIFSFVLFIGISSYADLNNKSFSSGLDLVKHATENNELEQMYMYLAVQSDSQNCELLSRWVDVEVDHATDVAVWMNVKKTTANINSFINSINYCKNLEIKIYLLHTHPKKSIKKNYVKSSLFNKNHRVDWLRPITVPPSMSDLSMILSFGSILKRNIKPSIKYSLVGAVVDPAGVYLYREFHKGELPDLFPDIEVIDFSALDNEESNMQLTLLAKQIGAAASDFSTQLNLSSLRKNSQKSFKTLLKAVAKYNFHLEFRQGL